jgi:diaminopimelate decarboxylase
MSSQTNPKQTRAAKLGVAKLEQLCEEHGNSLYFLDLMRSRENIREMISEFRARYSHTSIGHSYKTNYIPRLCHLTFAEGAYAEVVSRMEFDLAERLGVPPESIILNGPVKDRSLLLKACAAGTLVNVDSVEEAAVIAGLARSYPNIKYRIGLRCNIVLSGILRSRFGIDTENGDLLQAANLLNCEPNIQLSGLHCHIGGDRSAASYRSRTERLIELSREVFPDEPPSFLDIGGGFAGKMPLALSRQFASSQPSYADYAEAVAGAMANAYGKSDGPELIIESGMALFSDVMEFVCRVAATKCLGGAYHAIVTGSIYDIKPTLNRYNLPMEVIHSRETSSKAVANWTVSGYTCMESDILASSYAGCLMVGDFLVFSNTGAYTVVLKPPFIDNAPAIIAVEDDGSMSIARRREHLDDILASYELF